MRTERENCELAIIWPWQNFPHLKCNGVRAEKENKKYEQNGMLTDGQIQSIRMCSSLVSTNAAFTASYTCSWLTKTRNFKQTKWNNNWIWTEQCSTSNDRIVEWSFDQNRTYSSGRKVPVPLNANVVIHKRTMHVKWVVCFFFSITFRRRCV